MDIIIPIEKYRKLLMANDTVLTEKIQKGIERLEGLSFEDSLLRLDKLKEWKDEYEQNKQDIKNNRPKFCEDDIPF